MKKKKYKKIPLYLIITLFILITITIYVILNPEKDYKENVNYYTGDIYSLNYSANLIDNLKQENVVISPLNINQSLISFYLASDNKTEKELKSYYKTNQDNTINLLIDKYNRNIIEEIEPDPFVNNYEKLIKEFYTNKYNELTPDKITIMSEEDKLSLQLLIKKINLNYNRINKKNKMSIKAINKYKLNKKEINNNSYNIKQNIDLLLDTYESYTLKETITNDNYLYYNFTFEKDYLKELKKTNIIYQEITNLDLLKEQKIKSYIEYKNNELISINIFDYTNEWETNFDPKLVKSSEFYNQDIVTAVEMMFEEQETYLENSYAIGFKKNYKNNHYTFIGILPKKEDYKASNLDIDSLINNEKKGPVKIGLPRFSINNEINLKSLLSNRLSFNYTNLTKMNSTNPKINSYIQKTAITIGDKGSIDTKITVNKNESTIENDYKKEIIFNRPFYFAIINNETNDILLFGKVTNIR